MEYIGANRRVRKRRGGIERRRKSGKDVIGGRRFAEDRRIVAERRVSVERQSDTAQAASFTKNQVFITLGVLTLGLTFPLPSCNSKPKRVRTDDCEKSGKGVFLDGHINNFVADWLRKNTSK